MIRTKYNLRMARGSALAYGLIIVSIIGILFVGLIQFVVSNIRLSLRAEPDAQALHIAEAGVYFYRWHLAHNVEGKTATQVATFWDTANNPLAVDDDGNTDGNPLPSIGDCDDADTVTPDNYDVDEDGDIDSDDIDGSEWYTSNYDDGAGTVGQYQICVTPPAEYSTIVTITAKGWTNKKPNITHTVQARLRKPSWSEFAILSNEFMRLSSGTEIFGPIHGNEGFRFDGTSHNRITSSVETYYDTDSDVGGADRPGVWRTGSEAVGCHDDPDASEQAGFLAGKECPVTSIDFDNAVADFSVMEAEALAGTNGSLYFNADGDGRHINLGMDASGTSSTTKMRVRRVSNYSSSTLGSLSYNLTEEYTMPTEGIIYVRERVWVDGTVPAGSKMTIVAHNPSSSYDRDIYLGTDDLVYADYDSNTILGLAAERNVHFLRYSDQDDDSDDETGGELRIDAALLAQSGSIGWHQPSGQNWGSTTLNKVMINGALVSNNRLGFGYTSGSGFTNRALIFDAGLLFEPPPLFPTGDSYAIDLWETID